MEDHTKEFSNSTDLWPEAPPSAGPGAPELDRATEDPSVAAPASIGARSTAHARTPPRGVSRWPGGGGLAPGMENAMGGEKRGARGGQKGVENVRRRAIEGAFLPRVVAIVSHRAPPTGHDVIPSHTPPAPPAPAPANFKPPPAAASLPPRSEERRVGKECQP